MNPFYAVLNACNPMDLVYGSIYAIQLLAKGVGPFGNGNWSKRKGGYGKLKDPVTDIQMRRSATIGHKTLDDESSISSYEPMRTAAPMVNIAYQDQGLPQYEDHHESEGPYERAYHESNDLGMDNTRLLRPSQ